MTKETESDSKALAEDIAPDLESSNVDTATSRRQFTRQAIVGSAVLFSLGNRPAWSANPDCISVETWSSWDNGTHVSHHPGADYSNYEYNQGLDMYCPRGK